MSQSPRISVLIPSFRLDRYLVQTLSSLHRQSVRPYEVIVMDGGSDDRTAEVVEAFGDLVTTFVSERDAGQVDAVRKALECATGEICYFLNADDIAMPGSFERVTRAFESDGSLDIVFSDDYVLDDTDYRVYVANTIRGLTFWDHFLFYRQLYSECVFWRRSISESMYPFDTTMRQASDYSFLLPLRYGRKERWLPTRLGMFRSRPGQTSQEHRHLTESERVVIRQRMRDRLGMSEEEFLDRQRKHRLSFKVRQDLYPKFDSALRFVGRRLTGDAHRKRLRAFLLREWLLPPDDILRKIDPALYEQVPKP